MTRPPRAPRARTGPAAALLALSALHAAATGCGIRPTGVIGAGDPPGARASVPTITVYLVRGSALVPVTRPGLAGRPYLAVEQLAVPPTTREHADGLRTEVGVRLDAYVVTKATDADSEESALVVRPTDARYRSKVWTRTAAAQIACTAQTIPGVERVDLWGAPDSSGAAWATVICDDFSDLRE